MYPVPVFYTIPMWIVLRTVPSPHGSTYNKHEPKNCVSCVQCLRQEVLCARFVFLHISLEDVQEHNVCVDF